MWGRGRFAPLSPPRLGAAAGVVLLALAGAGPAAAQAGPGPTNDPGSQFQWHLDAIGAPAAWRVSTGKGATIAIVDTGVDLTHPDLQGGRITGAVTCLDTGGDAGRCAPGGQDDDGHGTHVAGIAAATAGNGVGVAGVAPDANILAVKVLREQCGGLFGGCEATGTAADVAAGIRWATDHGAMVINLSLGSTTQSVFGPGFAEAIEYAWDRGAIPVVASGNDFILGSGFSKDHAIVVDALNRSGTKASYSNGVGQAMWALSAPGGELDDTSSCETAPNGILSTYWSASAGSSYACLAGTSMAAPQVAGAVAMLRSAGLPPDQVVQRLLMTARDIGAPGADATYGAGTLDLVAATDGLAAGPAGATDAVDQRPTTLPAPPPTDAPDTTPPAPRVTATTDAPVIELPSTTAAPAGDQVAAPVSLTDRHDELPPGPVAAAVLLATGVAVSSGWVLVRGAGWARRTPGSRI